MFFFLDVILTENYLHVGHRFPSFVKGRRLTGPADQFAMYSYFLRNLVGFQFIDFIYILSLNLFCLYAFINVKTGLCVYLLHQVPSL